MEEVQTELKQTRRLRFVCAETPHILYHQCQLGHHSNKEVGKGALVSLLERSETMLVLTRRHGEGIEIDQRISILVVNIGHNKVKLGIVAPKEIPVHRSEIAAKVAAEVAAEAAEMQLKEASV